MRVFSFIHVAANGIMLFFFDFGADPYDRLERLERISTRSRLAREHDRVGAVEDRVRDVGRLGTRRTRVLVSLFSRALSG